MNAVVTSQQPAPAVGQKVELPPEYGVKVMLIGDSGQGKTEALKTLVDAGVTPFVCATEQNFIQTCRALLGTKMHYKFFDPTPDNSLKNVADMLSKINTLSYENLCKTVDPFRQAHNKIIDLSVSMNKFVCDCCKKDWGSVEKWNTDRALCIDSLSGLSDMAFALVVGNKPARALPDYGIAQQALLMLLKPLTTKLKCHFVLTTHLSREKDELTGGTTITASTVGNKLGPDLPRMFSDVIRARRMGDKFFWDTADTQSTVTARHVPIKNDLTPSFIQIINKWKLNGGKIEATV